MYCLFSIIILFIVKDTVGCWFNRIGINSFPPSAANMCQWFMSALVQIMACRLFSVVWWVINDVIVGLSQSAPTVGWGSPLHAWLASVNWIGCPRYLNRGYRYGARGMHYHILLRQYSQNYYTYNSVVQNTYSPCHKDACVQISIGNTEW